MIKLKTISIVGMHKVQGMQTYHLDSPVTYFVGKNGAGKSTILQAIQLALLGYIPGYNKQKSAIFSHANGPTMSVTLTLAKDDGELVTINRSWMKSAKTINSSVVITPENYTEADILSWTSDMELPIFNYAEFTTKTANQLKDWFISFLPKDDQTINWEKEITSVLKGNYFYRPELVEELIAASPEGVSGLDAVRTMNATVKALLSSKKIELERAVKTLQNLVFYSDLGEVTDPTELRERREDYMTRYRKVTEYNSAMMQLNRLRNQPSPSIVDNVQMETNKLSETVKRCTTRKEQIESTLTDISARLSGIRAELSANNNVISSNGICPYSNCACASLQDSIETITTANEKLNVEAIHLSEQVYAMTREKSELGSEIQHCNKLLADIREQVRAAEHYEAALKQAEESIPQLDDPADVDIDFSALIKDIDDKLIKIEANNRFEAMNDEINKSKVECELDIESLKLLQKHTGPNGMQNTLSEKPFIELADTISVYASKLFGVGVKVEFNLSSEANSFSFGINRDDKYISYDMLSSGEKCMYTVALLASLVASSTDEIKVIILDDMLDHLDDDNITWLMSSLADLKEVQFILAGVKPAEGATRIE